MKIATNVHRDAFGGITISNLALFNWLEKKEDTIVGIEFVMSRHVLGPSIYRHFDPAFFQHHIINAIDIIPRLPWEKAWNREALRRRWDVLVETAKEVLRREVPDVVLLNGTYYAPWILATAAQELGIPTVLRYAGVLQREINPKAGYFTRRRLLAYERWIASMADAIIYPSSLCRSVVETDILGRPATHGTVIPNPVEAHGQLARRPAGRYTIAAVGRWSRIKNFQAFVALHENLLAERWPHRAVLVTSYRERKFHVPETIERTDPMSHEDLQKFFRSVHLLVVPSHFETFCNVAAEALVLGTSVLVSENVGFSEILRKAGLGRMVIKNFDDPARVVTAVKRLAKTRLLKKEQAAVAKLLELHLVHHRILTVLQSVLTRSVD
ncbi:glycosyltransferase [Patescibacteria group bacterium]|nr:MAG: glycosyltransferase [Patescibacteria group bacterium]